MIIGLQCYVINTINAMLLGGADFQPSGWKVHGECRKWNCNNCVLTDGI